MITSLRIQNFKCWRDTGEMRFAPITAFFGANSSGKSSILQFLLMLKQTVESSDRKQVLNFGNNDRGYVQLGTFRDVLFRTPDGEQADTLSFSLMRHDPRDPYYVMPNGQSILAEFNQFQVSFHKEATSLSPLLDSFQLRFANEKDGDSYSVEIKRQEKGYIGREKLPDQTDESNFKAEPLVKFYGFSDAGSSKTGLAGLALTVFAIDTFYLGPLRDSPKREYLWGGGAPASVGSKGEWSVAALLASRFQKEHEAEGTSELDPTEPFEDVPTDVEPQVAQWLQDMGIVHSFSIEELAPETSLYAVRVRVTPESAPVLLTEVGFGVSQVLPVLTLCAYAPEHSIILLEQPELHLHPKMQSALADVLIDAMKNRNLQIILESHSEHLLTRLQRRMAEFGLNEQGVNSEEVALYFCERKGAEACLTPLALDEYGDITNWPANFFGSELQERFKMLEAAMERQQREDAA